MISTCQLKFSDAHAIGPKCHRLQERWTCSYFFPPDRRHWKQMLLRLPHLRLLDADELLPWRTYLSVAAAAAAKPCVRRITFASLLGSLSDQIRNCAISSDGIMDVFYIYLGLYIRARVTRFKTKQQDLKSKNLFMNQTIDMAQNRPLYRDCYLRLAPPTASVACQKLIRRTLCIASEQNDEQKCSFINWHTNKILFLLHDTDF